MSLNRRDLLRMGLAAGVGMVAAPHKLLAQSAMPGMTMPGANAQATPVLPAHAGPTPVKLASYVTPLAIPPIIRAPANGAPIPIHMRAFRHHAHRDLPATAMWGYNGMWPGPTLDIR